MTRRSLIERVVRAAALAALRRQAGIASVSLRPAVPTMPGRRQELLQVGALAGRAGGGAVRGHESLELAAAASAGVFE